MINLIGFLFIFFSSCELSDNSEILEKEYDDYACTSPKETQFINNTSFEDALIAKHEDLSCDDCDFVISSDFKGNFDGIEKNVLPGSIICLQGNTEYNNQHFTNLKGTQEKPIIITNCNGKVIIESSIGYGIKFEQCENIKLLGNGALNCSYGIKVSTSKGFFITAEKFTSDIEIAYIEVAGFEENGIGEDNGFAGIGVKTKPYCDGSANRGVWTCKNVRIHHNYIHDTGGEGMYIGYGFYNGRTEKGCDVITYSHSVQNVRIHNNIIANCGFDGIQIKNADEDVKLFNNIIYNFGTRNEGAHNEGLFIGEGTTGDFYNNWIEKGTGHGIQFQGMGNNNIFNNIIIDSGKDGFYGASGAHAYRIRDGYFNIYNNTIVNSARYGFVFYNNDGGDKNFINNLIVAAGESPFRKGATLALNENNLFLDEIQEANFKSFENRDLRPTSNSPMIDSGTDADAIVRFDALLISRPQGEKFDVGSYEYEK